MGPQIGDVPGRQRPGRHVDAPAGPAGQPLGDGSGVADTTRTSMAPTMLATRRGHATAPADGYSSVSSWTRTIPPRPRRTGRRSGPSSASTCPPAGRASGRSTTRRPPVSPRNGGPRSTTTGCWPRPGRREYGGGGLTPARAGGAGRGVLPGRGAHRRPQRHVRHPDGRQHPPALGHRGAEAPLPAPHPLRRGPCGARGTPSRAPVRTWPTSGPGPCSTATSG